MISQTETPASLFSSVSSDAYSTSSSYSSSDDYSPASPTPVTQAFDQVATRNYQQAYKAEWSNLVTTSPDLGNAPFVDSFDLNEQYLGQAAFAEGFDVAAMNNSGYLGFVTNQSPWEYMAFESDSSKSTSLDNETFGLCPTGFDGQLAGEIGELAPLFCLGQNTVESSTSTVLPSQTLKYPNPSPTILATPFISPVKSAGQMSSCRPDHSRPGFKTPAEQASVEACGPQEACINDGISATSNSLENCHSRPAAWRKRRRPETESESKDLGHKEGIKGLKVPWTITTRVEEKPFPCHPCKKAFDRQEHLTRHQKTDIHLNTLKTLGIPSLDPPPPTTPCPFCGKLFNRSDNLKPHKLTHMHRAGKQYRNPEYSIEASVQKGQDRIDPRINPTGKLKKRPTKKAKTK